MNNSCMNVNTHLDRGSQNNSVVVLIHAMDGRLKMRKKEGA
jgi:hypothetical protein